MSKSILNYLAHFLADWSLDDEIMPALLSMVPRKPGPKAWKIGWTRSVDGDPIMLIGESFQAISWQGQRAYTHLAINQLLLGQLEVDFGWSKDKETMFAYLWQAFLLLPESLQAYWPNCQILRTINGGTIDRDTLSIIIREKDLVNEFPSFLKLAKELQTHLSFRINDRAIPNIYQQRWLEQLSQSSGELPGNLEIFLRSQLATPSTVSWSFLLRNHLKRFLKTSIQTTAKRTSKRYGTVPGLRVQGHAKIGLAIDTSGSVSTASLNLFRNEIKKIADLGHSVEVVEADTRIQRRYNFHGKLPDKLVGGGGTNYDPAIQFFEKKTRADLLIYLTDGRGPRPLKWKNIPLIWVFHLAGSQQTYLKSHHADWPGRKVYLEKPGF